MFNRATILAAKTTLATAALAGLASTALAETTTVEKYFRLRSVQGLGINVTARIEQSDADDYGHRNRHITAFYVRTSEFGQFRAVLVLRCQANHYPNSWSYESSYEMDAYQSSGGDDFRIERLDRRQIEYASFGGDHDTCRTELALVKNGVWQTDPINGSNNFVLDL